ncbi:hypothetical protein L249_6076 [Ophiocordyceps polyrhachis-furcata BCC 54312]|uniref:U6 snRNA-associated Sm-like protein LSm1 n=1 Tax=Ophiocordyceps polyrhachis-furcata BCC 54312 TaxID=1330021 RepID=A0A367LID6_9HYPO|nr:hypothetical protein L249_6076 [Ophiocordyceps polyrhachis-furcata BCC 54312]
MENLSLSETPPPGGPVELVQGGPQPLPQLPPQMFTTAAQLLDLTDSKNLFDFEDGTPFRGGLMVILRDGRKLIGVLRSWDQFANLILQSTTERLFAVSPNNSDPDDEPQRLYADVLHGVFLVRGENVLLLGEIDLDKDDDPPPGYDAADFDTVKKLADERKAADKRREKSRLKKLAKMGFEGENLAEIGL